MSTPADHHRWRAERFTSVAEPTGHLALIETRWTGTRPDLAAAQAEAGPQVTVTVVERRSPETGETEYGLRVWDADSDAIRAYDRIDTYPFDPEWVLRGRLVPTAPERTSTFPHRGGSRAHPCAGELLVTIGGTEHALAVIDDGDALLLVFADETTGAETSASGRFLRIPPPDADQTVVVDFNRAFVPPCGFSAQYDCPLPPASHRLPLPIRAGEKNVVFVDGFTVAEG